MSGHPIWYVVYGALAAGVFEETGRFVAFTILRRRYQGVRTAVSYGIGHGGMEVVLVLGLTMVNYLIIAVMINTGHAGIFPSDMVTALVTAPPSTVIVPILDRVIAMVLHVSLSVIVWTAVTHARRRWLFPVAIVLHAIADTPAAFARAGKLSSIAMTESLTGVVALVVAVVAVYLFRQARAEEKRTVPDLVAAAIPSLSEYSVVIRSLSDPGVLGTIASRSKMRDLCCPPIIRVARVGGKVAQARRTAPDPDRHTGRHIDRLEWSHPGAGCEDARAGGGCHHRILG